MSSDKKVGFLGKYIAGNVNLANPTALSDWTTLGLQTRSYASDVEAKYNNNALRKLREIAENKGTPDELMQFAQYLKGFIETANKDDLRDDIQLSRLVYRFCETAKASRDKRVIVIATEIANSLAAFKN